MPKADVSHARWYCGSQPSLTINHLIFYLFETYVLSFPSSVVFSDSRIVLLDIRSFESRSQSSNSFSLPHHLQSILNTKMLVQYHWLWSLLFAVSASALLSSSSSSHHTSTTKKTTSSSLHTTHPTSTTKMTVSPTKSTKTSSASSTSTLSTFYLVAEDTGRSTYDGVYLHYLPDTEVPGFPTMELNPTNKNTVGAATFNLLANSTLNYIGASGPQFASVSFGHPQLQSVTFQYYNESDAFGGFLPLACKIAAGAVTCSNADTGLNTFCFDGSDGGTQMLNIYDEVYDTPVTLKAVPV